jgi:23S rRNA pseudouridine2605 synthase
MKERLQKIIARAGIASRRAAEQMILDGRISINGAVVSHLGTRADLEKDDIRVDGRLISAEAAKVYLMLNKPRGYVTTLDDPQQRPIVTDLLSDVRERVFPVGRLDYDSEGLLLFTNDGDFALRLQHPRFQVSKTYRVKIEGRLTNREMRLLSEGISMEDGLFRPALIASERKSSKSSWLKVTLREGRNRIVRRAFEILGHSVVRLIRVSVADLSLDDLKPGTYRYLTKKEVMKLMSSPK